MDAQEGDGVGTGLAATVEHYSDGTSSPEMSKGDGKSRATKGRSATASELYRAAKEATTEPFPTPARCHRWPQHARNAEEGRRPCSLGDEHCSQ